MKAERIRVSGIVQGVGFRPTVWRLAGEHDLTGQVWNDAHGVVIDAWGESQHIDAFLQELQISPPPLARIDHINREPLTVKDHTPPNRFSIKQSEAGENHTGVPQDAAICAACLKELFDPSNRRYRYPFINCTHCGPRLSIIQRMPYDRASTSMQRFTQCSACLVEYSDPADRRFHAQPNACAECGPRVWLSDSKGEEDATLTDPITLAAEWLRCGKILAIKGIGGFHLACDATHEHAVQRLRKAKQREAKPFAMMARDIDQIKKYACLTKAEERSLCSVAAPIVLCHALANTDLADAVAPEQDRLGFMLPYAPLHHLLLHDVGVPLVMTSGNQSDEPQCIDNDQALEKLAGMVDGFVFHDRDIVNRLDDSVVLFENDSSITIRRARGFAPGRFPIPKKNVSSQLPSVLAMGGELKNCFALNNDHDVIVSQYLGDLENAETLVDYQQNLALYRDLYDHTPSLIAVDEHTDYFSTQLGEQLAQELDAKVVRVQHHHAHCVAVLAEYGFPLDCKPVLGIAFDGLGMGSDGHLWGGEFFYFDYAQYQRIGAMSYTRLIGGSQAMLEPWRNTYAQLGILENWPEVQQAHADRHVFQLMASKPQTALARMLSHGLNSPLSSSCGRVFDAVAALLDIHTARIQFEGQAAMALEQLARTAFSEDESQAYPVALKKDSAGLLRVDWNSMWDGMLSDLAAQVPKAVIAARFHHCMIQMCIEMTEALRIDYEFEHIAVSGGCFQNSLLREGVRSRLQSKGYEVLVPQTIPMNDGGIAFGQIHVALAQSQLARVKKVV